jgi:hypothetical protein
MFVRPTAVATLALLAACPAPQPVPPKRPNTELIAGEYERHAPDGETAIRFQPDGGYRIAKNHMQFDVEPPIGTGTYTIDKDTLTIEASKGMCAESAATKTGTYKVVLSKIGIRFTKINDSCERRSKFDGQTWWRL